MSGYQSNNDLTNIKPDGAKTGGDVPQPDSQVVRAFSEHSAALQAELAKKKEAREKKSKDGQPAKGASSADIEEKKKDITITEHLMTVEETAAKWEVDVKTGLSDAQVAAKLEQWGRNELTPPPSKAWWVLFLEQMTGFFALLLWGAGILCFVAYGLDDSQPENLYLGIVLVAVVFMTGCFSYFQESKSAAVMEGFKNFLPAQSIVLRNGVEVEIFAAEIVPGDIVKIKSGEKIPADIRVVEFANFKVNNSSLTGESIEQKRVIENQHENALEATNIAFYGTLCVDGSCTGIVIATADRTVIGTIANLAATTENVDTPIAQEIHHFIKIISSVAVFLGVTFLIIGIIKGTEAIQNIVFCIGIIVANVPEGLLATVTVSLTLTAKRMAEKQVLVKNLEAVETLGSTTVIASDKTGTLTCNRMTVAHVWYNQRIFMAQGEGDYNRDDPTFQKLQQVGTLCNNAIFLQDKDNLARPILARDTKGDASESAFIKFCEAITPIEDMRAANKKIGEIPFNSRNKYQVSIHNQGNDWENPRLLVMKGAPERIWNRCNTVLVNGEKVPTADIEASYNEALSTLMGGGERVLGCCYTELPAADFPPDTVYDPEEPNFPLEDLTFVGLMSLVDPPRPRVPKAVQSCLEAGIKVVMVTGDHPDTAEAIAKQVHIIRDKTRKDVAKERGVEVEQVDPMDDEISAVVVTGAMLAEMDDKELDAVLDFPQLVFARTSPQQKLIIVRGLQDKRFIYRHQRHPKRVRHVVAVTGDGVNDSPALKAANIGIAMGKVGSDVAKDAADMILLNDNFASIVDGVEEGRLIFDNLKKSIAYTLSSNIPEISPFLINIILEIPLPLPTVLILCIDLGTDMVPAISLAYENKEANIMKKPPRDMNTDRLVTTKLISFSYLQVGVVQALAGFYTYITVLNDYGFNPRDLPGLADLFDRDFSIEEYQFSGISSNNPWDPNTMGEYMSISHPQAGGVGQVTMKPCNIRLSGVCHNPIEALAHAQCAFFVSIVVVQWADIIACKTRSLSLKQQGMRNGMLNFGLAFETILACLLCYVGPFNDALGTRPLQFVHWLPAMPFSILIVSYDEVRKYLLRNMGEDNWFLRNTYY